MSIEKDVVYKDLAGRTLKVDLYRPEGSAPSKRTAILLVHGGGWAFGERGMVAPLAIQLAAQGFLAVAVEYRLVPEAPWPAQRDDVVAAARWTAQNAERLGIEPDRVVLLGFSAGGHLAMMAAGAPEERPQVAAVVALFTPSELTAEAEPSKGRTPAAMLLGPEATEAAAQAASPLPQITADFPPVFLLHGSADWVMHPTTSITMYEKLVSLGVTAELHIVARAHHEFACESGMAGPIAAEIALFLDRVVIDPERWDAASKAENIFTQGPEAMKARMEQASKAAS